MKSTTDGVVVDHHDNHNVDGTPEGEPPATSLNPFDNEDDDDVVEEEE